MADNKDPVNEDTALKTNQENNETSMVRNRLDRLVHMRIDNDLGFLQALSGLPPFLSENTQSSRTKLRSEVEKRGYEVNQKLLETVQRVGLDLDSAFDHTDGSTKDIGDVGSEIRQMKQKHCNFLKLYHNIEDNGKNNAMKHSVAESLLNTYKICLDDIEELSKDGDLMITGFTILVKLKTVKNNCVILRKAGYEVLFADVMNRVYDLESLAKTSLYKWALQFCTNVDDKMPIVTKKLAMAFLQNDTENFNNILDEYCSIRRNLVTQSFIEMLTHQSSEESSKSTEHAKPNIEKYVEDLLIWIHQHIPIEKGHLSNLLEDCSLIDKTETIRRSVCAITNSICHTLQKRVENVIRREKSTLHLYHAAGLLQFYTKAISTMVPNSLLQNTLDDLTEICENTSDKLIQNTVKRLLLEKVGSAPADLSPTSGLKVLLNFMTSMVSSVRLIETKKKDTNKLVTWTLHPLLHVLNVTSTRLPTVNLAVYLLNCFHEIHLVLSLYEFTDEWLKRIKTEIDSQIDTLVSEQSKSFVANLNLSPVYSILQNRGKTPLSELPGMDPENLTVLLGKFENFVCTPSTGMLQQLNNICFRNYQIDIQKRSIGVILVVYRQLYNCVTNPINLYKDAYLLMPRSPSQMEALLLSKFIVKDDFSEIASEHEEDTNP